ncbi:hypothetical protein EFE32_12440 [Lactococcus lactis subsp. lactis]|uniref:hypothetical protein n=1 Tax=Lactococcus lactis TaxID=1358 RepID=UPI00223AD847|nr:hypothetical protein [Lactococcus lactis]MCT0017581.1 hypothetical protein [Lactococcus lactis subsp. lactis]
MAEKSVRVTISKDNETTELTLRGVSAKDIEEMFFAEIAVQKQMKSCEKKEDKHHVIGGEEMIGTCFRLSLDNLP